MSKKRIIEPGKNCWKVSKVTQTGLLVDGRDYFRAFYHAASGAERYILLSGWQFDSSITLLRGDDAQAAPGETRLLPFLNSLCEKKPALRVFILAWDFSVIYGLDREWFQELYFNWTTNERLRFCFDQCSSFDASHHQKFAVIDGAFAFVGGLDLCAARWDERDHRVHNPHRVEANGTSYRSFHDLQSCHRGPLARDLAKLFKARWKVACCEEIQLPPEPEAHNIAFEPTLPLAASEVAISRTLSEDNCAPQGVYEIRRLFVDAIEAAEELIYIENQYFSSEILFDALAARMKAVNRSRLEIVLVIAKDAEAFLEQLSIGIAQSRLIRQLREIAQETGHRMGIYYPASLGPAGEILETYVHSKLLLVDDRFLSVGSANMNNRSLGYDTELNVSWETVSDDELAGSIRDARVDLLVEHTGLDLEACRKLVTGGLIENLDRLADNLSSRLRHHPQHSVSDEYRWLTSIFPNGLPFDPQGPLSSENTKNQVPESDAWFFSWGISSLTSWLANLAPGDSTQTAAPRPPRPSGAERNSET